MSDLGDRLRSASERFPSPGAGIDDIMAGAHRKERARRISGGVAGVIVTIVILGLLIIAARRHPEQIPATPITVLPVLTGPAGQHAPFSDGSWLAWSANSRPNPTTFDALARPVDGGGSVRLNASGTQAVAGGFDPTSNKVIFQQYTDATSDIYLYDLDTGASDRMDAVSTGAWESSPRISTSYILFVRRLTHGPRTAWQELLLFSRSSGALTTIRTWDTRWQIKATSVGERYATWTTCRTGMPETCRAYVFDSAFDRIDPIGGASTIRYAAVIDEQNGLVYSAGGVRCGDNVAIWSNPLVAPRSSPTELMLMPPGYDIDGLSLAPAESGQYHLLFKRARCPEAGDIYEISGVIPSSAGPSA
jgi:hypothetical protein